MSTLTLEQQEAVRARLAVGNIPVGLGDELHACSMARINLALDRGLTDTIPDCMSPVIGRWMIAIQDAMPEVMRNSMGWRMAAADAAGTGREHEAERLALMLDWMWGTVLPELRPLADAQGFGVEWLAMTTERTKEAAAAVAEAAAAFAEAAAAAAEAAAEAAAAVAQADAVAAAESVAEAAAAAAESVAEAAAAFAEADADAWTKFNPIELLQKLNGVGQ